MGVQREDVSPWIGRIMVSDDDKASIFLDEKITTDSTVTTTVKDSGGNEVLEFSLANHVSNEVSISDDGVHSFSPAQDVARLTVSDITNTHIGEYLVDVSGGSISELGDVNGGIATGTGSHSGTTGTNGNLTVAADGTNGQVDIENRTGASVTVRYKSVT